MPLVSKLPHVHAELQLAICMLGLQIAFHVPPQRSAARHGWVEDLHGAETLEVLHGLDGAENLEALRDLGGAENLEALHDLNGAV